MNLAELFVEIGFKIEGTEQLTVIETALKNIASLAKDAKAALVALGQQGAQVVAPIVPPAVPPATSQPGAPVTPVSPSPAPSPAPQPTSTQPAPPFPAPVVTPRPVPSAIPPPLAVPSPSPQPTTVPPPVPSPSGPKPPPLPPTLAQQLAKVLTGAKALIPGLGPVVVLLKGLTGGAVAAATALVSLAGAFILAANSSRKAGQSLANYELATGVSTDGLQRWQVQARQFGVSGEEVLNTLKQIQSFRTRLSLGLEDNTTALSFFGLSANPNEDPASTVEQLRKSIRGLREDQVKYAREFAGQLGISDDLFAFLRRQEKELSGHLILTKEQQTALDELNQSWNAVGVAFSTLKDKISAGLAIPLKLVLDTINQIVKSVLFLVDLFEYLRPSKIGNFIGNVIAKEEARNKQSEPIARSPVTSFSPDNLATPTVRNNSTLTIQQTNNPTFNVNGAESPRETSREINRNLNQVFDQTARQMPAYSY